MPFFCSDLLLLAGRKMLTQLSRPGARLLSGLRGRAVAALLPNTVNFCRVPPDISDRARSARKLSVVAANGNRFQPALPTLLRHYPLTCSTDQSDGKPMSMDGSFAQRWIPLLARHIDAQYQCSTLTFALPLRRYYFLESCAFACLRVCTCACVPSRQPPGKLAFTARPHLESERLRRLAGVAFL